MGQRLSALDTKRAHPVDGRIGRLQWGQRLSALDTRACGEMAESRGWASMGPTPFSVGYMDGHAMNCDVQAELQWGQRLSALDTLRWRTGRTSACDSFNGANAFQRWIPVGGISAGASMGPTPFSVGYTCSSPTKSTSSRASMGPTPFSVGYRFDAGTPPSLCVLASMGPTPFSVGYSEKAAALYPGHAASMGPTPFSVGYTAGEYWQTIHGTELQWGQRLSALDTSIIPREVKAMAELQWGQRLSALDTSMLYCPHCDVWVLQWGQRLSALDTIQYTNQTP